MMHTKLQEINEYLLKERPLDKRQLLIKEILKDNKCFLKMDINTAYNILRDLNIQDNMKEVYLELIRNEEER